MYVFTERNQECPKESAFVYGNNPSTLAEHWNHVGIFINC